MQNFPKLSNIFKNIQTIVKYAVILDENIQIAIEYAKICILDKIFEMKFGLFKKKYFEIRK